MKQEELDNKKNSNALIDKKNKELFERFKSGDEEARNEIIKSNLGLVGKMAKTIKTDKMSYDDMVSIGSVGLMNAVNKYDVNKGKFSTYACKTIKNEIMAALSEETLVKVKAQNKNLKKYEAARDELVQELRREPTEEEIEKKLVGILSKKQIKNLNESRKFSNISSFSDPVNENVKTLEDTNSEEDYEEILKSFEKILKRKWEKEILLLCFVKKMKTKDVAKKLGLSQEYVRKVKLRVRRILKRYYNNRKNDD